MQRDRVVMPARPSPPPRPARRIWVLVVIVTAVLVVIAFGVAPSTAVAVIGGAGLVSAEIATRLLGPAPAVSAGEPGQHPSETGPR